MINPDIYEELFSKFPFALLLTDNREKIVYVNQRYRELLGPVEHMKEGIDCGDVFSCLRPSQPKDGLQPAKCVNCIFKVSLKHAITKGQVTRRKQWLIQHPGSIQLVEITVSPFKFRNTNYTLTILEDISHSAEISIKDGDLLADFIQNNP